MTGWTGLFFINLCSLLLVLPVDLHGMPDFNTPTDKAIAGKAAALILADLSNVYSISQLATEAGAVPHRPAVLSKKVMGKA